MGKVASEFPCETTTNDHMVMEAGEITTQTTSDDDKVVRGGVAKSGFEGKARLSLEDSDEKRVQNGSRSHNLGRRCRYQL